MSNYFDDSDTIADRNMSYRATMRTTGIDDSMEKTPFVRSSPKIIEDRPSLEDLYESEKYDREKSLFNEEKSCENGRRVADIEALDEYASTENLYFRHGDSEYRSCDVDTMEMIGKYHGSGDVGPSTSREFPAGDSRPPDTWSEDITEENGNDETSSDESETDVTDAIDKERSKTFDIAGIDANDVDRDAWIDNILMSLKKVCEGDYTEALKEELYLLLEKSIQLKVKTYLLKHDFLPLIKHVLNNCSNLELIDIVLDIVISTSYTFEAIDFIGNDKNIAEKVLSRLKSNDTTILLRLLVCLQIVMWQIMQNCRSFWIIHLKGCEYFEDSIISLLNATDRQLMIETVGLLQSMCEILLSENNFLIQLFKMDKLIPALMTSFAKLIPEGKHTYSLDEFSFISDWLSVLFNIQAYLFNFEHKHADVLLDLLNIMYKILMPYQYIANLYPIHELQNRVIVESVLIIFNFHYYHINVPPEIDHILAAVTFSLERELISGSKDKELDSDNLVPQLLHHLYEYWFNIVRICPEVYITDVLHLCKPKLRDYMRNLLARSSLR